MTIAQVAEGAGLSLPYVANLERGRGNPTLEALRSIAGVLEVPIGSLVDDPDALATPEGVLAFTRTERFQETVTRLAQQRKESEDELRDRIVRAILASPRRSDGELTDRDLDRLLDTFSLILGS